MCVCASRDTTDIGFYNVDVFEDKIGEIKLEDWKEADGLRPKEVADLIIELCDSDDYATIIVDCRGFGIAIVDELEKDREFTTPIYKANPNRLNMNDGIIWFNSYIEDNKFIVDEEVDIDLAKFNYKKILPNGIVTLDVTSYEKEFKNIVQLFTFVKSCVLDDKRIRNKTIIEKNLREILEILVDDLCNADKSNTGTINELVRLIDKVNYIRGQY
jgi:hypothetical protein